MIMRLHKFTYVTFQELQHVDHVRAFININIQIYYNECIFSHNKICDKPSEDEEIILLSPLRVCASCCQCC